MVATTLAPAPTHSPPAPVRPERAAGAGRYSAPPASSLLAPTVERTLGQQLTAGRQAQARLRAWRAAGQSIAKATGDRLMAQVRAGQQARARLITACAPLVEALAQQYSGYGVPREDLVQEGWVGVVRAAASFDPAKGPHFSRHAAWGARKAILDALTRQSRTIRMPGGVVAAVRQIAAAQHQWAQTELDPPGVDDLVALTGLPAARVRQVLAVMSPPLSLDAPPGPATAASLGAMIPADAPATPESGGLRAAQRQELRTALTALDVLAQQVIARRYGLIDDTPYSAAEVSVLLHLSEAEVQAIETMALTALRHRLAPRPLTA